MAVKFRKHIVSQGDTIQSISQKYYQDMSRWDEIARFNNLRHPYIVDTLEEKLKNPDHLVVYGDTLLIKVSEGEQEDLITDLRTTTEYDKEELYALSLGKDLDITPVPDVYGNISSDSEVLELEGNNKGDLATVRGVDNLKQSLLIRLLTPRGSYMGYPNFGSEVHTFVGRKNNSETATLLNIEIERTLRTDSRVTQAVLNKYAVGNNEFRTSFKVSTITLEEAFDFVVSVIDDGPIVLLDNFNENFD